MTNAVRAFGPTSHPQRVEARCRSPTLLKVAQLIDKVLLTAMIQTVFSAKIAVVGVDCCESNENKHDCVADSTRHNQVDFVVDVSSRSSRSSISDVIVVVVGDTDAEQCCVESSLVDRRARRVGAPVSRDAIL